MREVYLLNSPIKLGSKTKKNKIILREETKQNRKDLTEAEASSPLQIHQIIALLL